jgi:hypothetical protein
MHRIPFQIFLFINVLLLLLTVSFNTGIANSLTQIPDSLLKGCDAVYLNRDRTIMVLGNKAVITYHQVVKILNNNGSSFGNLKLYYQSNTPIKGIKGTLYDANGKKVRTLKEKDFSDVSMTSTSSLFDDYRAKVIEIHHPTYPYTVEYEYEQVYNEFISLPIWLPIDDYRVGILNASISVTFPDSNPINYKYFNLPSPSISKAENGSTNIKWEISNTKPIQSEYYSSSIYEYTPYVMFVPNCFSFHGSKGCFTSWETYGLWSYSLLTGRNIISDNLKNKLIALTSSAKTDREKVKIIYKYMQSQTRYVSIQLGLGGFQPFPASDVEKFGYGDCKALSNYTKALLEEVGIKAFYTEIGISRMSLTHKDFPSPSQTDHVILMVPDKSDTIWLECTSQRDPFGYLSHDHQGKNVLVVTENGGILRTIPNLGIAINTQYRTGEFIIDSNGNAKGELTTLCKGGEMENLMPEIWVSKKEQLEIINKKYRIPNFTIDNFSYFLEEDSALFASEKINFTLNSIAPKTGKRLFLKLNVFNLAPSPTIKSKERLSNLILKQTYRHIDSIVYHLPRGYKVEAMPKDANNTSPYGSFIASYTIDQGKLICRKEYTRYKNRFPAKDYNNFVDFINAASKLDNQAIVLVEE